MIGRGRTPLVYASAEDNPIEMPVDYFCNFLMLADAYLAGRKGFSVMNATPRLNMSILEFVKSSVVNFTKLGKKPMFEPRFFKLNGKDCKDEFKDNKIEGLD